MDNNHETKGNLILKEFVKSIGETNPHTKSTHLTRTGLPIMDTPRNIPNQNSIPSPPRAEQAAGLGINNFG